MRKSSRTAASLACVALLVLACASSAARAGNFSFSGSFATDDELATFLIDLAAPGDITALTLSYNGGTDSAGQPVAAGGFAPVLTLFDAGGNNIFGNAGSSNTCGVAFCWDAAFTFSGAPAGHYTLVLSQDGNDPLGQLADGFSMTGRPHYTAQYAGAPADDPSYTFIQIDGAQRSAGWALDVSVAASASVVPEPGAAALLAAGLAVVGLARLRRRR